MNCSSGCCGTASAPSALLSPPDVALTAKPRLRRERATAEPGAHGGVPCRPLFCLICSCAGLIGATLTPGGGAFAVSGQTTACSSLPSNEHGGATVGCHSTRVLRRTRPGYPRSPSAHRGCGRDLSRGAGDLPLKTGVKSCRLHPVGKDSPRVLSSSLPLEEEKVEVQAIHVSVDVICMIYSKVLIRWGGL